MIRSPFARARNLVRRFGVLERTVGEISDRSNSNAAAVEQLQQTAASLEEHFGALHRNIEEARRTTLAAANYGVRRMPLNRSRIRVLFLVHHIEAWDSSGPLVSALQAEPDFDVVVASIPRKFRGAPTFGYEDKVHAGLQARGVAHLRIDATVDRDRLAIVRALDPDIIFRQSQWDADVPEAFSTVNLGFARLCLLPYETMNIVENYPVDGSRNSAVDSEFHRAAWMVFCTGEKNLDIAVRDNALGGQNFIATGHPKADHLRSVRPSWPKTHGDGPPRHKIIWSAHHSIADDWIDFGLVHLIARDMLEWARSAPEIGFVFMPHPALAPMIDDPETPVSPEEAACFLREWHELPNTAIFTDGDYGPLLAASDLMITDGLSMLIEYQFMEKPLIFVERPGHRPFNDVGRHVMTGSHTVQSADAARRLAESFLSGGPDPLHDTQRRNMAELFGEEPAVPRIVAALRGGIAAERRQPAPAP